MSVSPDVTQLLNAARLGDPKARDAVLGRVYDELRQLAGAYLRRERPDHTLQATALVHEAYIRLVRHDALPGESRGEFLAAAAQAMRRILVDHARRQRSEKRGAGAKRVRLDVDAIALPTCDLDLEALEEALQRLAKMDARKAKVIELRFFGGLSNGETAQTLGVSTATIERDWKVAKTWLLSELGQ